LAKSGDRRAAAGDIRNAPFIDSTDALTA